MVFSIDRFLLYNSKHPLSSLIHRKISRQEKTRRHISVTFHLSRYVYGAWESLSSGSLMGSSTPRLDIIAVAGSVHHQFTKMRIDYCGPLRARGICTKMEWPLMKMRIDDGIKEKESPIHQLVPISPC